MLTQTITAIMYTYSWNGFIVEYADGSRVTMGPNYLLKLVGEEEYDRLSKIAHANGLTGIWYPVPAK